MAWASAGPPPPGGTFGALETLATLGAPEPIAYFPLTNASDFDSILLPSDAGYAENVLWVEDPIFSATPLCQQYLNSSIFFDVSCACLLQLCACLLAWQRVSACIPACSLRQLDRQRVSLAAPLSG